ncbi:MAG TPA: hypothetical protein VHB72_03675 [Candidatus Saccharimonadales bacterium]|nr:hypothetical protein [Candidatus Saccharimonadales bacterium]
MFGMRTPAQIERMHAFDVIIEKTGEALADPETAERLGALGVDLAQMNDEAFLPNMKRGKISLPRDYRDSNGVAIVPLLDTELGRTLGLSFNMFAPTPRRRQKMEQYAVEHPHPHVSTEEFLALSQNSIYQEEKTYKPELWRNSPAHTVLISTRPQKDHSPYFSIRPIIFVGMMAPIIQIPGMASHEYTHASDAEALERPPRDMHSFQAYRELRGYFAQFVMFDAAGIPMTEHTNSVHIERLRRSFDMPLPPQNPDEPIPADLVKLVHDCAVG